MPQFGENECVEDSSAAPNGEVTLGMDVTGGGGGSFKLFKYNESLFYTGYDGKAELSGEGR